MKGSHERWMWRTCEVSQQSFARTLNRRRRRPRAALSLPSALFFSASSIRLPTASVLQLPTSPATVGLHDSPSAVSLHFPGSLCAVQPTEPAPIQAARVRTSAGPWQTISAPVSRSLSITPSSSPTTKLRQMVCQPSEGELEVGARRCRCRCRCSLAGAGMKLGPGFGLGGRRVCSGIWQSSISGIASLCCGSLFARSSPYPRCTACPPWCPLSLA